MIRSKCVYAFKSEVGVVWGCYCFFVILTVTHYQAKVLTQLTENIYIYTHSIKRNLKQNFEYLLMVWFQPLIRSELIGSDHTDTKSNNKSISKKSTFVLCLRECIASFCFLGSLYTCSVNAFIRYVLARGKVRARVFKCTCEKRCVQVCSVEMKLALTELQLSRLGVGSWYWFIGNLIAARVCECVFAVGRLAWHACILQHVTGIVCSCMRMPILCKREYSVVFTFVCLHVKRMM